MPIPLYGFLQGDTVGLLILADEGETVQTLARKLQFVFFGAQQDGEMQAAAHGPVPADELTTRLTRLMAGCGLMKASLLH